jgi:signal transduction histidine kinase
LGRAFARDVDPDSYRVRFMIAGVGVSGTSLFGWWLSGRDDGLLAIACLALPLSTWLAIAGEPASPRSLASAWRGPVDSCLSVEQIARGIAHSMLKPVTAAAQRLRSAVPRTIDSQLCSDLMAALELMDHTQRLIRDLLDLARSQGHLERREVKVQPVLHQAVAQVQQRFPHAQIDLRSTSGVAFADEVLVRCALVNLIENALEAQGGSGWVSVRAEHDGHHARLVVEDRAGGLPVEVEERLFEPFVTTKSGGTGLGLAVVHEVCRAHGGSVTRQRTGDGTRFVVTLPSRSRARSQRVRVIRP